MAAISPSTSGPVRVTRGCASPVRSSSPTVEPGWFENVEAKGGRGRDGIYGISHRDDLDFFYGNVDSGVETWMGTWSNSELARSHGVGRETRPFGRFVFLDKGGAE